MFIYLWISLTMDFPGGPMAKNPPAMQEKKVWSLGQEDPLGKEMATHSSISCLGNPMDRDAWPATEHGIAKESHMTEQLNNNTTDLLLCDDSLPGWRCHGRQDPPHPSLKDTFWLSSLKAGVWQLLPYNVWQIGKMEISEYPRTDTQLGPGEPEREAVWKRKDSRWGPSGGPTLAASDSSCW